jgi:hypothetical protein
MFGRVLSGDPAFGWKATVNVTKGTTDRMKHFPRLPMTSRKRIILTVNVFAVLVFAGFLNIFSPIRSAHAQIDACGNSTQNYTGAVFKDESTGTTYTFNNDGTIISSDIIEVGGTYTIIPTATSGAHAMLTISITYGGGAKNPDMVYYGTPTCLATTRVDEITGVKNYNGGNIETFLWDCPAL